MHFTSERLAEYLRGRLGAETVLQSYERFPRGTSRETWFATIRRGDAPSQTLVFRADLPAGSVSPTELAQEYFIYEHLSRTHIPIARALWWEDDTTWSGEKFYVREKVDGSWRIPHYSDPDPQYDHIRIAAAKEHIAKLAMLHQLNWKAIGLDERLRAPKSVEDAAHVNVEVVRDLLRGFAMEALPIVPELCEWLHDNAPIAPCISFCKGTNGYGEEVFQNGRIVALSDWEEASIGDPTTDFAFTQEFLLDIVRNGETIWSLDHALAHYHSVSGLRLSKDTVNYYRILYAFRTLVMSHNCAVSMRQETGIFIRQAWTATEVMHVMKRVLAAATGLMPPLGGSRMAQLNHTVESVQPA